MTAARSPSRSPKWYCTAVACLTPASRMIPRRLTASTPCSANSRCAASSSRDRAFSVRGGMASAFFYRQGPLRTGPDGVVREVELVVRYRLGGDNRVALVVEIDDVRSDAVTRAVAGAVLAVDDEVISHSRTPSGFSR